MAIQTRPISNNESYDRWQEEVIAAARDYRKGAWALADKLLEGMDRFGEAMFFQVVNDTGLSQHTVDNYLSLARAFPVSRRRENVSLSIHDAVRKLPDEEANAMLMLAEKYQWTREAVRDRVKAWKAGDLTALQAGWKPKLPAKIIEVEDDEPQEDDDKPVMDGTAFGEGMAAEKRERERGDDTLSDAHQILMRGLDTVERALNAENRRMLPLARLNTARLRAAAKELTRLADEADAVQSGRMKPKQNAGPFSQEATAKGEADGTLPSTASPNHPTRSEVSPPPASDATGGTPAPHSVSPTHSHPAATAAREAGSTGEGDVSYALASPVNSDEPDLPEFLDRRKA